MPAAIKNFVLARHWPLARFSTSTGYRLPLVAEESSRTIDLVATVNKYSPSLLNHQWPLSRPTGVALHRLTVLCGRPVR